jgi:4-amino-4-deoxy-L-arabinose transferase-like glycosyltransferase
MSAVTGRRDRARSWLAAPEHQWLVGIVAVGFGLRLGWGLGMLDSLPEVFGSGDQYGYVRYAREIAAGEGYVSYTAGTPTAYYPIGYPALLAALFWSVARLPFTVDLPNAVALLHAVLGATVVLSTWALGRRALGATAAMVAAAVVALHPDLIAYTAAYTLETAFLAFGVGALAVVAAHDWGTGAPSRNRVLVFGVLLAATTIIRPFALPFVGALVVAILLAGAGWRRAATAAAWVLLIVGLVLAPWTVRNWVRLDAFVPISTNLGDTACMARFVGSDGGFAWAQEGCAEPTLPDVERNQANLRKAAEFVREHPGEEVRLVGRRLSKMFEHGHSGVFEASYSGRGPMDQGLYRTVADLSDAFLVGSLLLGLPGLALVACRRWRAHPGRALIVLPTLTLFAIPLLLWGNPRFAMPLAPFLALGAGASVAAVAGAVRSRRPRAPSAQ